MIRSFAKLAVGLLGLFFVALVALGGFAFAREQEWLSPLGLESSSRDSQVIQSIERTEEVSLLSLGVQGIKDYDQNRELFGKTIPGTGKTAFLQYNFHAKLGLDGSKVTVTQQGEHDFTISVPAFAFIGYEQPTFKVAAEDGGVLSWATPEIDKIAMVNEILNDDAQAEYIASNEQTLQDQTKVFYDTLIKSVDPEATTTFEFKSRAERRQ
ncbi:hypothetical protein N802_11370 [Knoellia sinensis KCTC 19936]|uniref:DUF4230 domain-containing protein n=1 Tax=Knoellia sinensis KCTC 19936 TaxID=1385520 RepID=A0A0A0IX22_9MICO|nr:hypothetical protein [Knoellia sinensis]KGN29775.1 hypothetical protein N802_11370 [Knoellia sinensis KCTC 19936]